MCECHNAVSSCVNLLKSESSAACEGAAAEEKLRLQIENSDILPLIVKSLGGQDDLQVKEAAAGVLANFNHDIMVEAGVIPKLNSVNAQESKIPYPWLAINENFKVSSVFLRDSSAVSDSVLLVFGGTISKGRGCGASACDSQVYTLFEIAAGFGCPVFLANWWHGDSPCHWPFVACDPEAKVVEINLAGKQLFGTITSSILQLTKLQTLNLSNNYLYGQIPEGLSDLYDFSVLDISNNNFSGDIPNFVPHVQLSYLGNPFLNYKTPTTIPKNLSSPPHKYTNNKHSFNMIIGICIAVGVLFIVIILLVRKSDTIDKSVRSDINDNGEGEDGERESVDDSVRIEINDGGCIFPNVREVCTKIPPHIELVDVGDGYRQLTP
ncbi:hypothetical protein ACFE04_029173 [Oxalis oulophora]